MKLNGIRDNSDIPRDRINDQILNGNLPKMNGRSNSALAHDVLADEEYDLKKIPVFNYSCDLLRRPLTWKEFMKMNEDQEPVMPSSQSVSQTWKRALAISSDIFDIFHVISFLCE